MMSQARFVRPPRIAAWLVNLFAPDEQAESISGDLLEEFSDLASKSGVASARRWYWRQGVKTIAHLIATGFRVAPWSIVGTVLGGYVLLAFGASLPERAIVAVLHLRNHHVNPYYTSSQVESYLFWLNNGILTGRLLMSLSIGSIVAVAAKGREMVATTALSLFLAVQFGVGLVVQLVGHWAKQPFPLSPMIFIIGTSLMIVIGGGFVRRNRSATALRPSNP